MTGSLDNLIRRPVISEKSTRLSENSQVVFLVPPDAAKPQIKRAVEEIFKVKVKAVNTMRRKGKVKRFRGVEGRRAATKKAVVTLAEGHAIDLTSKV